MKNVSSKSSSVLNINVDENDKNDNDCQQLRCKIKKLNDEKLALESTLTRYELRIKSLERSQQTLLKHKQKYNLGNRSLVHRSLK